MDKTAVLQKIENLKYLDTNNFFLFAGPCVVESEKIAFETAERILEITDKLKIPFVYKSSYRKANRQRIDSFTGIGDQKALKILQSIAEIYEIPVVTDIHSEDDAFMAAQYVDVIQIPAFLCRQTELLIAAAKTGRVVNIKKGQFVAPESMKYAAEKVAQSGNPNIILTERGSMFGYYDLVVDYRSIIEMQKTGYPVMLDITHSLQQPNLPGGVSGGRPELIETIARAGIAVGVDGIFIETHPNPAEALSDGANMLRLDLLEPLLEKLVMLRQVVNKFEK
ncbi:MAG: 3-deoxy-8-phosphooctulonate synthase [Bacteroidales bacterium]|nr:3-deoxy-8-phosphooctulonate synthase [Bacteroidales bacterium]HPO64880.1 3-deoxy-8-phosphooctulonate synthase [Bacteroidales bacterium]